MIDFQPVHDSTSQTHDSRRWPPPPMQSQDAIERLRRHVRQMTVSAPALELAGFQVRGEIGRGAMGIVLEAVQLELKRVVAIKVLPAPAQLSPELLARFRAEGEAAARLRHPNVVEVHTRGEIHGQPYLVMEYVDGGSLADRLNGSPLSIEHGIGLIVSLARAIARAHESGVVHRDLKPANVLLTKDGTPKIADFGLAKLLDDSALASCSDAVIGTPAYMAPEQVSAGVKEIGPAADIYALGAMLYECLTGRPPFCATVALATLELVRTAEPISPRRLNPAVPRDLETICLKCLRKEPAQRYLSATELADDLERFRDGLPIVARPVGAAERAWKWSRRRPAAAALIAVTALGAIVGGAGLLVHADRMRQEADRANRGEAAAIAARNEADANYQAARDALQRIVSRVDPRRTDVPTIKELRRIQVEDALAFYRAMMARDGPLPEMRFDAACAGLEAGRLEQRLGQRSAAEANLRRSAQLLAALALEFPAEVKFRSSQAEAEHDLSALLLGTGRFDEALGCQTRSLALRIDLAREFPQSHEFQSALALSHHGMGNVHWSRKQAKLAEEHYRQSVAIREVLTAGEMPLADERRLADTEINLSVTLQGQSGRFPDAAHWHDRAEQRLERIASMRPDDADVLTSLAMLRVNWAYTLRDLGRPDDALVGLEKNIHPLETALAREPADSLVRDRLHCTFGVQAQLMSAIGRPAESAAAWERVVLTSPANQRNFNCLFWAGALESAGEFTRAIEVAETARAGLPGRPEWEQVYHLAAVGARVRARAGDTVTAARAGRLAMACLTQVRNLVPEERWRELRQGMLNDAQFDALKSDAPFRELVRDAVNSAGNTRAAPAPPTPRQ